ncbi:MAG: hypothetical protein ACOY90_21490, partial [Candidatus Zhuqueibacterota bacterium]
MHRMSTKSRIKAMHPGWSACSGTQVPFHLTRWIHIQRDPVLEINPECDALMHRMSTKSRIKA